MPGGSARSPDPLPDPAIVTVAARWRAQFESWSHARAAREQGVTAAVIEAIRREDPPFTADDERAVHRVARELTTGQLSQDACAAAHRWKLA